MRYTENPPIECYCVIYVPFSTAYPSELDKIINLFHPSDIDWVLRSAMKAVMSALPVEVECDGIIDVSQEEWGQMWKEKQKHLATKPTVEMWHYIHEVVVPMIAMDVGMGMVSINPSINHIVSIKLEGKYDYEIELYHTEDYFCPEPTRSRFC